MVNGITLDDDYGVSDCQVCIQSKQTVLPFSGKRTKATQFSSINPYRFMWPYNT